MNEPILSISHRMMGIIYRSGNMLQ